MNPPSGEARLATWRGWLGKDTHPAVQFVKYGLSGVAALTTDQAVFYALAWGLIPALGADDLVRTLAESWLGWSPAPVEEALRARNFLFAKTLSFLAGNTVAYVLNVKWVFKGGRHRRHHEIRYFFLVSTISFALGAGASTALVHLAGWQSTLANVTQVVAAVLINYAGRKFLVFKG